MNKIGILGSGWLGLALAEKAKKKGHQVWTTTTTKGKLDRLQNKGFHAQYLSFSEKSMVGKIDFFKNLKTKCFYWCFDAARAFGSVLVYFWRFGRCLRVFRALGTRKLCAKKSRFTK